MFYYHPNEMVHAAISLSAIPSTRDNVILISGYQLDQREGGTARPQDRKTINDEL